MKMDEEKLKELLLSNNIDDVILGCRIAAEHLGEEWCLENFTDDRNYPTNSGQPGAYLVFDNFSIWVGPSWIQYYKSKTVVSEGERDANRISFETK